MLDYNIVCGWRLQLAAGAKRGFARATGNRALLAAAELEALLGLAVELDGHRQQHADTAAERLLASVDLDLE